MDKWSRKYNKCRVCKTTDKSHAQHGFCTLCWSKRRYKKEKSKYKKYFRQYWLDNKEELSESRKAYYLKRKKEGKT